MNTLSNIVPICPRGCQIECGFSGEDSLVMHISRWSAWARRCSDRRGSNKMFSSASDGIHIRSRLHFSQSSQATQATQATPSQALNSAFRECNLGEISQNTQPWGDVCMTQGQVAPSQSMGPSQPLASQALNIG